MCRTATVGPNAAVRAMVWLAFVLAPSAYSQTLEWRQVGNGVLDAGLAGPAGGAVDRVWYSASGETLFARLSSGQTWATADFETWNRVNAGAPRVRPLDIEPARLMFRGQPILGGALRDAASSPRDADEIAAATASGAWRSLDGGRSWTGLNAALPNFPAVRIVAAGRRARVRLHSGVEAEWFAGLKDGWSLTADRVEAPSTGTASEGDYVYLSNAEGTVRVSADRGASFRGEFHMGGALTALWVNRAGPAVALAATRERVFRTVNGGLFWDDITASLPGPVRGLAADASSGAIYAATAPGLFVAYGDLRGAGPVGEWTRLAGPRAEAPALDVRLDDGGHQLYALFEGHGLYATMAPHRFRDPRVVNAADHSARAAAPGSLISILGAKLTSVRAGNLVFPVLAASDHESQVQVPFEASGTTLQLALSGAGAMRRDVQIPLRSASPAILVDRDGAPMILDADKGVLLDPGSPAQAGSRLQIIATGLGKVAPDWPTGVPAPAQNAPRVAAQVRAYVDRIPVNVTRATLAPGFVGFYLVEIELPAVVNNGPAELYLEAAGQQSERVSVQLAQ